MADLKIRNLQKGFDGQAIIKGIDLDVRDREFVVFVGPSGCGKSTLLRLIAGLEEASGGSITLDGTDITDTPPAKRDLAMVFQTYALYPHMTVRRNLSFALDLAGVDKREVAAKVDAAARILELQALLERKPRQLSGGQRQRVAIGRAIVRNPKIFLFDEPLSNLDAALRVQMRLELARLHQELAATMIYVTHDQVEAMTLADKVVVLNGGRVEQVGSPLELYHHPANLFVAGFLGTPKMGFLRGHLSRNQGERCEVALECGARRPAAMRRRAGHRQPGDPRHPPGTPEHRPPGPCLPGPAAGRRRRQRAPGQRQLLPCPRRLGGNAHPARARRFRTGLRRPPGAGLRSGALPPVRQQRPGPRQTTATGGLKPPAGTHR